MIENNYLQELLKHTNIVLPFYTDRNFDYISANKFPAQNEELINTRVTIKYRDFSTRTNPVTIEKAALITDITSEEINSSRPEDDIQKPEDSHLTPEELSELGPFVEKEFRVLRADAVYPYKLIAIDDEYSILVINSSYYDEMTGKYAFEDHVSEYPMQQFKFIGASCISRYRDGQLDSIVFRADSTEPAISILYETALDEEGNEYHRFTIGDEVRAMLIGYLPYDSDDKFDFSDLDFRLGPEPERIPYDLYNFGDITEGDYPDYPVEYDKDYDFGDMDIDFGKTDLVGVYDFGDLIEGIDNESVTLINYYPPEPVNWNGTAEGDWDFDDLDLPHNPDTVVVDNTNYDFNVFADVTVTGALATNADVAKYRKNIMEGTNNGNL